MNKKLVDIVLEAEKNCLHFRMELKPDEFFDFIVRSDRYTTDIVRCFFQIDALIPRMSYPEPNPNNGHPFHTYDVGNEYSSVVYLKFVKAYLPKDFNFGELQDKLHEFAHKMACEEMDVAKDDGCFEFRFWWD